MPYNPFDKPIGEILTADDLQQLIHRQVAEGYYVEYKSNFPKNDKIGRSIASFANTYSGWYIVGVEAPNNTATNICGFTLTEHPDAIAKVQDVVKTHLDPAPVFYPQLVLLDEDLAVLVVYVPDDQETPIVTRDGRIYRRTHESSDPIPENNRFSLDRLVDQGRQVVKQFEEFCQDERTFSQVEERQGWVSIFLSPYPLGVVERPRTHSIEDIEYFLALNREPVAFVVGENTIYSANIPFNIVQPTHHSVIVRQTRSEAFNSFAIELFGDGRAKFHIPLSYLEPDGEAVERFTSVAAQNILHHVWNPDDADDDDSRLLRFFDMYQVWLAVAHVIGYYHKWMGDEPLLTQVKSGVRLDNVWRAVAVVDSDEWATYVERFGLPVMSYDTMNVPLNIGQGLLLPWEEPSAIILPLIRQIGLAFGLPKDMYIAGLIAALQRAGKLREE